LSDVIDDLAFEIQQHVLIKDDDDVAGETSGDYLYSVSSAIVESVTYDDPNDYSKFNATLHLNGVPTLSAVA